jgi:uncharacterized metal-binding protein YceD (DUF177 family)
MPILFNWRHLEKENLVLGAELPFEELDLEGIDECITPTGALKYTLEVQLLQNAFLAQGRLALPVELTCVRCLKRIPTELQIPNWACHLARDGEEKVTIVNDCVDLTPYVREDILLAFPQHPLCESGCDGLPNSLTSSVHLATDVPQEQQPSSAWAELNKLKL